MSRKPLLIALVLAAASCGLVARAADNETLLAGGDALRMDPPRWSIPAETPEQKYAVAMKEAGAALEEARKDCRATRSTAGERKACEAEAHEQWKEDVREARRHLSENSFASR